MQNIGNVFPQKNPSNELFEVICFMYLQGIASLI